MKRLVLLTLLLPLFTVAQKKKKVQEPVIQQPVVTMKIDPITSDTSYMTNSYTFWQDSNQFSFMLKKGRVFLLIYFRSGGEYVGKGHQLQVKLDNEEVVSIPALQYMKPDYILNYWTSAGIYLLDEKMISDLLAHDLKYIRINTSSYPNEFPIKDQDKDAIKRFLTAISKK